MKQGNPCTVFQKVPGGIFKPGNAREQPDAPGYHSCRHQRQKNKEHHMHFEEYFIDEEAASIINETKRNGGRIISVGTTSTRTVESAAVRESEDGAYIVPEGHGSTGIFIYPGYKFKIVDSLITNFHLPESTLLMLVSALAGRERMLNVYREAVEMRYRFFSFGDAMFIE